MTWSISCFSFLGWGNLSKSVWECPTLGVAAGSNAGLRYYPFQTFKLDSFIKVSGPVLYSLQLSPLPLRPYFFCCIHSWPCLLKFLRHFHRLILHSTIPLPSPPLFSSFTASQTTSIFYPLSLFNFQRVSCPTFRPSSHFIPGGRDLGIARTECVKVCV